MAEERRFDIVLLGATGVVGSRAAEHLAARAPASMRWGLAGRDGARLEALRARLAERDPRLEPPAVVVLDAADGEALAELARSARVMMSALGPYLENGGAAVAACAAAGTDYVDVAAEAEFVDGTYLRNQAGALASGARLVHCCGVESLAADLGTRFTVEQLPTGVPIAIDAVLDMGLDGLRDLLGRLSAGSLSSAVAMLARWRRAAAARSERRAREPEPAGRRVRVLRRAPRRGSARGTWLLPAPALDARYVGRSAAALARYGPDFSYSQQVAVSSARAVLETLAGGAAGLLLAQWPPTRR
ncbi:MAG TPA: saccharopine dehydrogenase NADP-binding domain-containing protein, partial [Solirubrobacteraceae bacterium]